MVLFELQERIEVAKMVYMKFHANRAAYHGAQDGDPRSAFAPLNPAHLTHEPVRRPVPWARFLGAVAVGAVVVEALRFVWGY